MKRANYFARALFIGIAEVTNMRPAKEFPAAREHFGETSTFKHFFPRLIFAMRYQKLSP